MSEKEEMTAGGISVELNRINKKNIAFLAVFALALLCLAAAMTDRSVAVQAMQPRPGAQSILGEYSTDGETWFSLTAPDDLSCRGGDLYLRGNFSLEIPEETAFGYFSDHLAVTILINGEMWHANAQAEFESMGFSLFPALCGRKWEQVRSPGIGVGDEIEIHLHNMHDFGSINAFHRFVSTMYIGGGDATELVRNTLDPYTRVSYVVGVLLIVASLLQLGAAAAFMNHLRTGLFCTGMMCLCAGGFVIYDAFDLSFWSDSVVLNTCLRQSCIMLCVLTMGLYICDGLGGLRRRTAEIAVGISAGVDGLLFILAALGKVLLYDGFLWWAVCHALLCPVVIGCCTLELRRGDRGNRLRAVSGIVMFTAVLLDLGGIGAMVHSSANCSKITFLVLFGIHAAVTFRVIVRNQQASVRVANLEQELEESRFDVALSQIQPHFLYNALGSIYHLCGKDPERAQKAVSDFSDYLRVNLGSIRRKAPVPFDTELRHVETYLELEKMSAGEELSYRFDIRTSAFSLPVLSLQPLVENAVKHGVLRRSGGGTVVVATREYDDRYEVTVSDDGVGFAPECAPAGDGIHIGIRNVRQRLDIMCGGTLTVNSEPDRGTTAVITLPKGGAEK